MRDFMRNVQKILCMAVLWVVAVSGCNSPGGHNGGKPDATPSNNHARFIRTEYVETGDDVPNLSVTYLCIDGFVYITGYDGDVFTPLASEDSRRMEGDARTTCEEFGDSRK